MKKIRYSDFDSIQEIISNLDLTYNKSEEENKQKFFEEWKEIVGDKIASVSKPVEINDKNILTILCANSFAANELFLSKNKLLIIMEERLKTLNLKISDIRFDYKNWKTDETR